MYLTFDDFTKLGFNNVSADEFADELSKAEVQIDMVTNYFYADGLHDLDDDLNSPKKYLKMRAKAFKRALGLIICYAVATGVADSNSAISGDVKSLTIGRTQLDMSDTSSTTYGKSAVPNEVIALLIRWGFLYRGVDYR